MSASSSKIVKKVAKEYSVSESAVEELYRALLQGSGSMAQFSHPELGGSGQWMSSGMIMIGDMFNNALKAKVDAICRALVPHLAEANVSLSQTQRASSASWWPEEFSNPSSVGGQNNIRYAYFPAENALVIDSEGEVSVYDTKGLTITGFSQQQASVGGFCFSSTTGMVTASSLPRRAKPRSKKK